MKRIVHILRRMFHDTQFSKLQFLVGSWKKVIFCGRGKHTIQLTANNWSASYNLKDTMKKGTKKPQQENRRKPSCTHSKTNIIRFKFQGFLFRIVSVYYVRSRKEEKRNQSIKSVFFLDYAYRIISISGVFSSYVIYAYFDLNQFSVDERAIKSF